MRYVVTALRDDGSAPLAELGRTYRHDRTDLTRVKSQEGLADDDAANAWCVRWAISRLLDAGQVTITGDGVVAFADGVTADRVEVDGRQVYPEPPWSYTPPAPEQVDLYTPGSRTGPGR